MRRLRRIESVAWCLGLVLLGTWAGFRIHGRLVHERDLDRFEEIRAGVEAGTAAVGLVEPVASDFSLWSPQRLEAYERTLALGVADPIAVLRIPELEIEVAVLEGTQDFALDRGVGHIEGTAAPGEPGNVGIAGHRDGFFRGLKDIARGDIIELATPGGTETYVVDELTIVDPEAVDVLAPTEAPSLTLVTCYPFYFVGPAPKRFIVRGTRAPDSPSS